MCGEDGLAKCTKGYLCSTNVSVMMVGIGMVAMAIITKGNSTMGPIIKQVPTIATMLGYVIALGVLTFLVAAVGCVGAMIKQKYVLMAYAGLLGVMILVKFIIAIVLFVKSPSDIEAMLQQQFDENPALFNGVETVLSCCGVTGIETYTSKGHNPSVTCCDLTKGGNIATIVNVANVIAQGCTKEKAHAGCSSKLWPYIRPAYIALGIMLIVLCAFEAVMLLITLLLLKSIMDDDGD